MPIVIQPQIQPRVVATRYYCLQGAAVLAWWILLWQVPASRTLFQPPGSPGYLLLSFWLPDLVLIAAGSWLAAWLTHYESRYASTGRWLVAGALAYATLYCVALSLWTGAAWTSVLPMLAAAGFSASAAWVLPDPARRMFRLAAPAPPAWNVAKTFIQVILFWGFFLAVIPALIHRVEMELAFPVFSVPGQTVAIPLFAAFSALGLWSAITMTRLGEGTPLPLDCPRRLVVAGPYRYVRNPMAVAGLGQGLMVGLSLGSYVVSAYVLAGAVLWNVLARPLEEADLRLRFGREFESYCDRVKCWWPVFRPPAL